MTGDYPGATRPALGKTLGPSPKDPLLAGEPKKASSGSSTPRVRLSPQGDRGAKPAPFYESAEPNIPAASYCGMACPAGTCKTLTIFHDGTHGLSPGTDGSNPLPSSAESRTNLTSSSQDAKNSNGPGARFQTPRAPDGCPILRHYPEPCIKRFASDQPGTLMHRFR